MYEIDLAENTVDLDITSQTDVRVVNWWHTDESVVRGLGNWLGKIYPMMRTLTLVLDSDRHGLSHVAPFLEGVVTTSPSAVSLCVNVFIDMVVTDTKQSLTPLLIWNEAVPLPQQITMTIMRGRTCIYYKNMTVVPPSAVQCARPSTLFLSPILFGIVNDSYSYAILTDDEVLAWPDPISHRDDRVQLVFLTCIMPWSSSDRIQCVGQRLATAFANAMYGVLKYDAVTRPAAHVERFLIGLGRKLRVLCITCPHYDGLEQDTGFLSHASPPLKLALPARLRPDAAGWHCGSMSEFNPVVCV
jgi:hypothetical protein